MNLVEKEILLERRHFAVEVFALAASLVLFGLAIAQGIIYLASLHAIAVGHGMDLAVAVRAWDGILAISLLALVLSAWRGYRAWKDSARHIGPLLDKKLAASRNRLEASAELSQSSDPLAVAQREETAKFLARNPLRRRSYVLALATVSGVALLILNGALATKCIAAYQALAAKLPPHSQDLAQAKKPELPKAPQVPVHAPYAKIDIVAPESETRATPIEEVVVKGDADSDNGFSAVSMQASIDGGPDKSMPIDPALFNKGGEIKFNQSLLLDELGAQPYDVVSYYLQGTSRHATPLKVSSQMQFIEVRPFREDVHKVTAFNGDSQCFAKLTWLISQQVIVSKRTWIIATNQLAANNPVVVSETAKSGDAQDKIAQKTHELYQVMTEKGYSASIVDHVSQAEAAMHQAVGEIRKPELLAASPIQRHALGELVEATKNFIRVTAKNPAKGSNPNLVKNPFKDRQKLPSPTGPAATNPMVKLAKLIKREQDIVKDLASTSSDAEKPGSSPEENQTAQNPPGAKPDQSSTPQPGSPSPSPAPAGAPPAPSPSPGGSPTETASNSPSKDGPQGSSSAESPMAQEQSLIARELADLQEQPDSMPSSNPAMAEAQQAAQSSADKIAAQDHPGALDDARAAQAAMMRAQLAIQEEASREMRDALAQAQQQLHDAAGAQQKASNASDQATVKAQADAARDSLAQEKAHQSASGDPKLVNLADALAENYDDQSGIPQKLEQLTQLSGISPEDRASAAELMSKFAEQMSAKRLAMQTETQNLEDTIKRIDRVTQNMNSAHGTPEEQAQFARELQTDLNTALSDGKALLPGQGEESNGGNDNGGAVGSDEEPTNHKTEHVDIKVPIHPVSPVAFQGLREPLAAFREEIEQRLAFLRDQETLTYLNPDESPEEYRAQVAAYYERISREAKAAASDPAAQPSSR